MDVLKGVGLGKMIKPVKTVFLGGQSSGKSSTIENIIGQPILPKGKGTVTRGPLDLRLHKTDPGTLFYGVF